MSKKDIHKTGALGAILGNKGLLTATEVMANKKKASTLKNTETYNSFFNKQSDVNDFTLIQVPTSDCTPWQYANRSSDEFGDLKALSESLKLEGQQEPILVRPTPDRDTKYEVIFGRRRYEAAKLANIPLIAICKELTDQEAAVAQKAENENRESISAYSEALHYRKLLDSKCFKSESELSRKINIPKTTLSNMMSFTKIPNSIIEKIRNIHAVSIRMAVAITTFINKDTAYAKIIENIAPLIGGQINSAKQLQSKIEKISNLRQSTPRAKPEVLKNEKGEPLIIIEKSGKMETMKFTPALLSRVDLNAIRDAIIRLYGDN